MMPISALSAFDVSYLLLWLLVLTCAILVMLLYRHFGLMALGTLDGVERDGLGIGDQAPDIVGVDSGGSTTRWRADGGRSQLVLFAAPGCAPCDTVVPFVNMLAGSATSAGLPLDIVAVVPGPAETARQFEGRHHPAFATIAEDASGAFHAYRVRVTPFGFVVGEDGRVRSKGLCSDPERLRRLLLLAGLAKAGEFLSKRTADGAIADVKVETPSEVPV